MMIEHCPVCQHCLEQTVCMHCGYDRSSDRELFPTLGLVPLQNLSVAARRKEYRSDYNSENELCALYEQVRSAKQAVLTACQAGLVVKAEMYLLYADELLAELTTLKSSSTDSIKLSDFDYLLDGSYACIRSYKGTDSEVVIPERIRGVPVLEIMDCAFFRRTGVKTVIIPEGVERIGNDAFSGCNGLTSAAIPSSVTGIGERAFADCVELESVTIPPSIVDIGAEAFRYCRHLTTVSVPKSIKHINDRVFIGCTSLSSVTLSQGVTSIGKSAFSCCKSLGAFNLPEGVTIIAEAAFEGCHALRSISLPESLKRVEFSAFAECKALVDIYYAGTSKRWKTITIDNSYWGNHALKKAAIHFITTSAS